MKEGVYWLTIISELRLHCAGVPISQWGQFGQPEPGAARGPQPRQSQPSHQPHEPRLHRNFHGRARRQPLLQLAQALPHQRLEPVRHNRRRLEPPLNGPVQQLQPDGPHPSRPPCHPHLRPRQVPQKDRGGSLGGGASGPQCLPHPVPPHQHW